MSLYTIVTQGKDNKTYLYRKYNLLPPNGKKKSIFLVLKLTKPFSCRSLFCYFQGYFLFK